MQQFDEKHENSTLPAKIANLSLFYRRINRSKEVASVLVKFGFEDFLIRIGRSDLLKQARSIIKYLGIKQEAPKHLSRAERVRLVMEELGLVFIKWGQYLSTRNDLLPNEYIKEFSKLQDEVAPIDFETVESILRTYLDSGEISYINPNPLAAASIGQVHLARLSDGEEVVVKIRRPGLKKLAEADLNLLIHLAEQVEKYIPTLASTRPKSMVEEFSRSLMAELDFSLEAINLERFGRFYANNPKVKVPKVYRTLCSKRVLVMEKLQGIKFDHKEALLNACYDLKELSYSGAEVVFEQILVFGYFHADPHPGNLLVQQGPQGPRIALLDFGLVGKLNRQTRNTLIDLAMAAAQKKSKAVTNAILKIVEIDPTHPPDRERLEVEVDLFLEANIGRSLKELNAVKMLNDIFTIASQHQLSLPPDLVLLAKALSQLEGVGLKLNPDFDIQKAIEPFVISQYRSRYNPKYIFKRLYDNWFEVKYFLEMLPRDMKPLYNMFRSGRFKCDFNITGLEDFRHTVDRASYRLSFAVVLASLLIGSSIVIHADMPPKWKDLPILGLLGFLGAGIVGFWLLYDFIKNRRL